MKVKGGIFIYASDIMEIRGVPLRSAEREMRLIKDVFNKKTGQVTVFDCAKYWDIEESRLIEYINEIRSL